MALAALQHLCAATRARSPYFCSGKLVIPQLSLFFCSGSRGRLGVLDFPSNAVSMQVDALCAAGRPATFGCGGQSVLDPNYRDGLTLDYGNFALTEDINNPMLGVLPLVQNVFNGNALAAESYHVNIYTPGGHFRAHRDTPTVNQIGSLVLSLPVDFSGGAIVVCGDAFKLGGNRSDLPGSLLSRFDGHGGEVDGAVTLPWCAFFGDCEHWVEPVTSGCRVTVTYRLLSSRKGHADGGLVTVPRTADLAAALDGVREALAHPSFLPRGGQVAIPLQHGYPGIAWPSELRPWPTVDREMAAKAAAQMLKGSDSVLFESLEELGLSPQVWAAVRFPDADKDDYDSEQEGEEESPLRVFALDPHRLPHVSQHQVNIDDEDDMEELVKESGGKKLNVHCWVEPILETSGVSKVTDHVSKNNPASLAFAFHEHYGNEEGGIGSMYMSAIVVARILPWSSIENRR
mmetsp:Transcript_56789/g.104313  ORF Transcript_56789/g.104313 Transcript_56789/m.104313 type:complete len:459 (+) Transcript_56789:80-1456(+)